MKEVFQEHIKRLLETENPDSAAEFCRKLLQQGHTEDAELWFLYGKALWKMGKCREATVAFRHSVDIKPEGQAKTALEMCDDIASFFNPDLLNP